jgi:hypothetical protein
MKYQVELELETREGIENYISTILNLVTMALEDRFKVYWIKVTANKTALISQLHKK